ncbi:hypothetical protein E1301_Tti009790 [Triplophysa tibetana]|uniref:Uncharacterized protein n=1 Tax=Triplophysa tibetana TaxID=1572043 RepID=A0A5A9N854_9TELE|nr:hypothetical protein E1301_Tti009790 [Triplophysa tibetana]
MGNLRLHETERKAPSQPVSLMIGASLKRGHVRRTLNPAAGKTLEEHESVDSSAVSHARSDCFIDSSSVNAGFRRTGAARSVSRIALRRNMYPARRAAGSETRRSVMSRRAVTLKWSAGWILMFAVFTNTCAQDFVVQNGQMGTCHGGWREEDAGAQRFPSRKVALTTDGEREPLKPNVPLRGFCICSGADY